MNQSHKIVFFYKDHVCVKLWEKNSKVYVHLNKETKNGTQTLSFQADAFRALMERRDDIVKTIDDLETEVREDFEMTSLTDEAKFNQQQLTQQQLQPQRERQALTTNSRFQPYSGTGSSIQFALGRGFHTNRTAFGRRQDVAAVAIGRGLGRGQNVSPVGIDRGLEQGQDVSPVVIDRGLEQGQDVSPVVIDRGLGRGQDVSPVAIGRGLGLRQDMSPVAMGRGRGLLAALQQQHNQQQQHTIGSSRYTNISPPTFIE